MRDAIETAPAIGSHLVGKTSEELLDEHRRMSKRARADVKALGRRTDHTSFWVEFKRKLRRKATK